MIDKAVQAHLRQRAAWRPTGDSLGADMRKPNQARFIEYHFFGGQWHEPASREDLETLAEC